MIQLLIDDALVNYEYGQELESAVRAKFLISDTEIPEIEVIMELADDEVLEINLPYVSTLEGKHYYSLPYKLFTSIDLTIGGTDGDSIVTGSFSTLSSLITEVMEVDAEKYIIDIENSIDCASLSERTIFDTDRTSLSLDETTFTTTIDGESVVVNHFDELADEDKSGWTPLGWSRENVEGETVAPTQPDGTTGIIFEIKGTGDTRKTLSNFKLDLKAPWKEDGDYNNTTLGGFGTTKSKYPCGGVSNTKSFINGPRVAFSRHCAGYKLNNVNFTNIDFKSSTRSPSLFAVNVYGDINVDGVDITGDFMAQAVSCYDMGLFFAWHNSGNTSIKNVNIDVQMRSGRWSSGMIGSSYATATSQPRFHVFENIVLNGYHNSEWWHDCDRLGGSTTDGGGKTGVFIGTVRAGNNITCKNVVINADVTTYRGYWSNESGYMFGMVNGSDEFSTTITLNNVKLNGDMLWSYGSAHAQCFGDDIMNPSGKEGYGVYPYDPLDSSLSEQDKIDYRPPYVTNRRASELNGERTERPCGWHGYYLIGHSYHYVNLNLKDFEIQGTQYYANEILDLGIIKPTYETGWPTTHHPVHFYINGKGPFYYHEPWANNNSKDGTSNVVEVASELSEKKFKYYSPNDPTDDALNKRFNINDIKQTTSLSTSVSANSTTLQVVTNNGMSVGDKVILAQGTEKEEENEIASFGSIVLKYPLTYDHDPNTEIQIIAKSEIEIIPPTPTPSPTISPTPSLTPVPPEPLQYVNLDGTLGGYVSVDNELNLSGATSFSWWFNAQQSTLNTSFPIIHKERQIYIDLGNGRIRVNLFDTTNQLIQNQSDFASEIAIGRQCNFNATQNQWYHFVVTYDGGKTHDGINFYVDGVKKTVGFHNNGPSDSFDSFNTNSDEIIAIGSRLYYYSIEKYHGQPDGTRIDYNMHKAMLLDDISIFNSELTESNVATLYNSGRPGNISSLNPFCWWKMSQGDVENEIENEGTSNIPAKLEGSAKFYPPTPYSVEFTGSTAYMNTGSTFQSTFQSDFSISCWFKQNSSSSFMGLFGSRKTSAPKNAVLAYITNTNSIVFWVEVNGVQKILSSTAHTSDNNWHHFCGTVKQNGDEVEVRLYIDGEYKSLASNTVTLSSYENSAPLAVGARNYASSDPDIYFDGKIDEVAIFDSALSDGDVSQSESASGEIATLYNNGIVGDLTSLNPVSWWKMGDAEGGIGTTIADEIGENNGTLIGEINFTPDVPN